MSKNNYKDLYNKIGQKIGWNFDNLQVITNGETWNFYQEVQKKAKKSDILLDIGTGGGEKILKIASFVRSLVGIDNSREMIKTARKNLKKSKKSNIRFLVMDANHLKFPDNSFNIISCRHSDFKPQEVARVLTKNGYFLTQQVSEADKINLKTFFKRGQNYRVKDGTAKYKIIKKLKRVGFRSIKSYDYDAKEFYKTKNNLIFLLKNTPIIPNFGRTKDDLIKLDQFIEQNKTKLGIKTNAKRYMIMARK